VAVLYQNDFLTTLAYLMGEKTVNSSTSAPRADFIQSALHDAYGAYPWRFAKGLATLTITGGMGTLPTNYDDRHFSLGKFAQGTTEVRLDPIDANDDYQVESGDRAMWVEPIRGGDGTRFGLYTKDSDVSTVILRYQQQEPTLDSAGTIGTPYPNKRTIALGSRIYVKLGQNPDADISQEEKIFERELTKDIAQYQVQAPRKRRRTAQGQTSRATGDW
jgi:hypothetical protein